jgi:predicted nucleic acid-binding protein
MQDEMAAAILMKDIGRDFDGSLQYYIAKRLGLKAVVSFDKHFDQLDIPRIKPRDVIEGKFKP